MSTRFSVAQLSKKPLHNTSKIVGIFQGSKPLHNTSKIVGIFQGSVFNFIFLKFQKNCEKIQK